MGDIKSETAKGVAWGMLQKLTLQPIQFIFGIILARLISPEEMGILGLTGIFFALAATLQSSGFGTALIRKQDRTEKDINTVFWFNVLMSLLLSGGLFALAPWFADFFQQPALLNLTRLSAAMMFLQSTTGVHWTLYNARRDFKTPAIVGMITTLVPMPFTVWAAYAGWSYWAPMVQGVISGLLGLLIVWIISPWKPRLIFSCASFRDFFGFSARLAGANMVWTIYSNLRTFIIGKFYTPADLALFTRGYTTTSFSMNIVQGVVGNVTYPILATIQHDQERMIRVYRQYIRLTALAVSWGMITMASNSRSLILVLYGEQWVACSFYAALLCFSIVLDPVSNINNNLYAVLGRTDITLRKEVLLRIFGLTAMIIGACHSVTGVCVAAVFTGWMAFILSVTLTAKICPLRIRHQLADFFPYLLLAVVANIPSVIVGQLPWPPLLSLAVGGWLSLIIYVAVLLWFKDPVFKMLLTWANEKSQPFIARFRKS